VYIISAPRLDLSVAQKSADFSKKGSFALRSRIVLEIRNRITPAGAFLVCRGVDVSVCVRLQDTH